MTEEERKERRKEYARKYYEANREKLKECSIKYYEDNREKAKEYSIKYYEDNREKLIQDRAKRHAANPEKSKASLRKYYEANREKRIENSTKWQAANPKKQVATMAKWRSANPELVKAQGRRSYAKKKADPVYLMARRVRARMYMALREKGFRKESTTAKMLGCSWEKFTKHIESQFTDGMSWDNRSEWHLDHVLPLSCATTIEGLEKLSHYTNIRPLWAAENLRKSDNLVLIP
jgi:hypothetical protein